MKTIGIGKQDFASLREHNCFYIDKTDFIKEWWNSQDDVTLITRPRRFGKTLTLFRETYHSVTSRFFSNNTCWKLIFAIHFISPTRLNKILFFYCIIMHYPV